VVAEAGFLAYVIVLGRRAAARGLTGALGEQDAGGWLTDRDRLVAPLAAPVVPAGGRAALNGTLEER